MEICIAEAQQQAQDDNELEAIAWWNHAASLLPLGSELRAELLILVAVHHGARKEYELAREALWKVLEVPPSMNPARRLVAQEYIGSLYWQQGRRQEALAAMEEALLIALTEDVPQRQEPISNAISRLDRELELEQN